MSRHIGKEANGTVSSICKALHVVLQSSLTCYTLCLNCSFYLTKLCGDNTVANPGCQYDLSNLLCKHTGRTTKTNSKSLLSTTPYVHAVAKHTGNTGSSWLCSYDKAQISIGLPRNRHQAVTLATLSHA